MRLFLAAAVFALASPAAASVGVFCDGPDGVSVAVPLGGSVGLSVLSATVSAAGQVWTSETSLEDPQVILPAQAFGDAETMRFDFADANYERNVVEIRLFFASEGAIGGTLSVAGVGSWVISCTLG